jgi:hypothetical protein
MYKEVIITYFRVLPQNLSGDTEGNHENPDKLASLQAKIRTQGIMDEKQE